MTKIITVIFIIILLLISPLSLYSSAFSPSFNNASAQLYFSFRAVPLKKLIMPLYTPWHITKSLLIKKKVIIGSCNLIAVSEDKNTENMIIVKSKELAMKRAKRFFTVSKETY